MSLFDISWNVGTKVQTKAGTLPAKVEAIHYEKKQDGSRSDNDLIILRLADPSTAIEPRPLLARSRREMNSMWEVRAPRFQVGKRYVYQGIDGAPYECIAVHGQSAWLALNEGTHETATHNALVNGRSWKEAEG